MDVPPCCYCAAPWTVGGYAHTPLCFITTGNLSVAAARKAKDRRAQRGIAPAVPECFLPAEDET